MAKGSGKKGKGTKSNGVDRSAKVDKTRKPTRSSPVRTAVHDSDMKEVSATRAFIISFILFSVILAPVLGLGAYFLQNTESIGGLFSDREGAFLGGMAIGVAIAFVISIVFTRRAVAQPS